MIIRTTKNETLKKEIKSKIKENGGYCPCAVEHNPDTKCMCKQFRTKIDLKEAGFCHCGLYEVIKEKDD